MFNLPTYYVDIDNPNFKIGKMSIVEDPAVHVNFLAFANNEIKLEANEEKRIITGVALRADYDIFREVDGKWFNLNFTSDDVYKFANLYMQQNANEFDLGHSDKSEKDIYLLESYFLSDALRPTHEQFNDVANGSWMISLKVNNDEVWQNIKSGNLNGFSATMFGDLIKFKLSNNSNDNLKFLTIANYLNYGY